ncbi:uncharacterized protein MELLADRAFT_66687 [Melampsora larici-populina 98AG31]|uniref:RNase III domain-containing protein n=1 Tax=Melampsora larici-populina (strain 98AG31 / pathotype 3-4-7) TaxID=747676 RepID=F4S078_MELLP|nr:uncharacterized protein MELLADRAFT_66687 [Melampsora larici-populina 98AG31]EGG01913.1 hypothetical protein MELLADRAFT_66687 [Melampsora larici-populina 98AG31]
MVRKHQKQSKHTQPPRKEYRTIEFRRIHLICMNSGKSIILGLVFLHLRSPDFSHFEYHLAQLKNFFVIEAETQTFQITRAQLNNLNEFLELFSKTINVAMFQTSYNTISFLVPLYKDQYEIQWNIVSSGKQGVLDKISRLPYPSDFWTVASYLPKIINRTRSFLPYDLPSLSNEEELTQQIKNAIKNGIHEIYLQKIGVAFIKMICTVNLVSGYPYTELQQLNKMRKKELRQSTLSSLFLRTPFYERVFSRIPLFQQVYKEATEDQGNVKSNHKGIVKVLYVALGAIYFSDGLKRTKEFARTIGLDCYLHHWYTTQYNDVNDMEAIVGEEEAQEKLNYRFRNPNLLRKALTLDHPEFRLLEWIGDSVLDVWAAMEITKHRKGHKVSKANERFMDLTNNEFLGQRVTDSFKSLKHIIQKPRFLGKLWLGKFVEALIGAVFLDRNKNIDIELLKVIDCLIKS